MSKSKVHMTPQVLYFIPWGGLGDALLATPALAAIKNRYPNIRIICSDDPFYLDLFRHNPHIDDFLPLADIAGRFSEISAPGETIPKSILNKLDRREAIFYPHYGSFYPSTKPDPKHAIDLICEMIGLSPLERRADIYLAREDAEWAEDTIARLGRRVILLHPKAVCSKNKEWYPERWAEVITWCAGRGFTVIQVGAAGESPLDGAVSFLGRTTIRQALALVKHCYAFIGIDSVFNHAAHGFGKPAVVLFGASTPRIWGYLENANIYKALKCQPCIDLLVDKCQPRYCMQRITAAEVIKALSQII